MVFGGMVSMEVSGQSKPAGVGGNKSWRVLSGLPLPSWHAAGGLSTLNLRPCSRGALPNDRLHTNAYKFDILDQISFRQL